MGVTIHYQGRLRDLATYDELTARIRQVADRHEWLFSTVVAPQVRLPRVVDGRLEEYVGPIKGVVVNPHEDCESLRFLLDNSGRMQGFVKTQFCPVGIHVHIVELLRSIEDLFIDFQVLDEGEYWETGRLDTLEQRKRFLAREIEGLAERLNRPRRQEPQDPAGPDSHGRDRTAGR